MHSRLGPFEKHNIITEVWWHGGVGKVGGLFVVGQLSRSCEPKCSEQNTRIQPSFVYFVSQMGAWGEQNVVPETIENASKIHPKCFQNGCQKRSHFGGSGMTSPRAPLNRFFMLKYEFWLFLGTPQNPMACQKPHKKLNTPTFWHPSASGRRQNVVLAAVWKNA